MSEDDLKAIYQELCNSYRAIDDFRTKLLGFLPLATGAGVVLLSDTLTDDKKRSFVMPFLEPIGLFGLVVTIGLLFYEIHGIKKCFSLIMCGEALEQRMGFKGQFATRPEYAVVFINEPVATALIYPAVLAAWTYVFLCGTARSQPPPAGVPVWIPISVFVSGFAVIFLFGRFLRKFSWL
jgi:hypothetical protein